MKKNILLGLFFLSLISFTYAQSDTLISNDSIHLGPKKGFPLTHQGETLNTKQLGELFAKNPLAKAEFEIAKTNQTFGLILGAAGGFMFGWTLGTALGGGEANWLIAGVGAACIIGSIPLSSAFRRRTLNAVEIYNTGLYHEESTQIKLDFRTTPNGLGLVLRF